MTDEEIDYSDIPPLTDEQLAKIKPLREVLSHLMKQAFTESGYTTRKQIVDLVREVRQEMVGN